MRQLVLLGRILSHEVQMPGPGNHQDRRTGGGLDGGQAVDCAGKIIQPDSRQN